MDMEREINDLLILRSALRDEGKTSEVSFLEHILKSLILKSDDPTFKME